MSAEKPSGAAGAFSIFKPDGGARPGAASGSHDGGPTGNAAATAAAPEELQEALATRFLRYSQVSSQSEASCGVVPSSQGQWELARLLEAELRAAGAAEVHLNETCVLTALIPATGPDLPAIGFCTHLDTADAGLSPEVHARVVEYAGGDLPLGHGRVITVAEHPEITQYAGQRMLVTDGTSVLGADDKAGVATIMELACRMLAADRAGTAPGASAPEPHGPVYLSFVPDEEIGLRGVRTMDLARFPVEWAYTLDCCGVGELAEETFNAATATVHIEGVAAHPMSAKGVLVNPILIAGELIAALDPLETPEHTEGREAYLWVHGIEGNQSRATVTISIRDHDAAGYEEKKARLRALMDAAAARHPRARLHLEVEDVYANLAGARTPGNEHALAHVYTAMDRLGLTPRPIAMRGGTDGSWLSTQGIFTPNLFTGAHNFHSWAEFLPLPSFAASYLLCQELVRLAAGR